jgi:hypothetical protein
VWNLKINDKARSGLLSQGGPINQTIGAGVGGAGVLISQYFPKWNFKANSFPNSLKRRGFSVSTEFPEPDALNGYKTLRLG